MMAVKVYNLPALGELNKVQLIREIRLHGSMAHRNIIELYVAFQVSMGTGICGQPRADTQLAKMDASIVECLCMVTVLLQWEQST